MATFEDMAAKWAREETARKARVAQQWAHVVSRERYDDDTCVVRCVCGWQSDPAPYELLSPRCGAVEGM